MTKKAKIYIIVPIVIFISLGVFSLFLTLDSKMACPKINRIYSGKTTKYVEYFFEVDGNTKKGSEVLRNLKIKNIDSLQKIDCIEIRYSKMWSFKNWIVDKRVLKV